MLPERFGGAGMGLLEGVALYEELGRSLASTPHFVSAIVSGGVLASAGSEEQQASWLPRIATGEAIVTPAWLEPENGFGPEGVQVRAVDASGGWTISGVKRHVAFAGAADALLVLARTGADADAVDLFLVDPSAEGVTLTQQFSLASDTQYLVETRWRPRHRGRRVVPAGSGWETWDAVMHDAIVLLAAQAMGGAQYALEIAVQYAKDQRAVRQAARSVPRPLPTTSRMPSRQWMEPSSSCMRLRGRGTAAIGSIGLRRWRSSSRATPSET